MITTLTPNPSFDLTLKVKHLKHGRVTRAVGSTLECAGKGINVTRALGINGYRTKAVLPAGITDTEDFSASISRDGGTVRAVPIGSKIRTNVTVIEPDGTTTKINTSGPPSQTMSATNSYHKQLRLRKALAGWSQAAACLQELRPTLTCVWLHQCQRQLSV